MKLIGLTGNIGTGKSTVAVFFACLQIPIYTSDEKAKNILLLPEVVSQIKNAFGKNLILPDNTINRKSLANVVFNNAEKLATLNSIIHPLVLKDFINWTNKQNAPYVIQESAILFESGFYKHFDKIITVTSPPEIIIKRVMRRDNITEQQVLERLANQWTQEKKAACSDFVIYNNDKRLLIPQILAIHQSLV